MTNPPNFVTEILGYILTDTSVKLSDETKLSLHEYFLEMDPERKDFKKGTVKLLRKLIRVSYENRNFSSFEYFLDKAKVKDPIFERFYRLNHRQFTAGDVHIDEWKKLVSDAKSATDDLRKYIHNQLIVKYVHLEDVENAATEFKHAISSFQPSSQDVNLSIGILKLFAKKNRKDEAEKFLNHVRSTIWDKDLQKLMQLKLMEVTAELQLGEENTGKQLWKTAFEKLDGMNFPTSARENLRKLRKIYDDLESKHTLLLDVRVSDQELAQLQNLVVAKVKDHKPYQLLRLGDGESYAYLSSSDERLKRDRITRELKWWGIELPANVHHDVVEKFKATLRQTDVIGIPSIFRFIRAMKSSDFSLDSNSDLRGSWIVLEQVHADFLAGKLPKDCIFVEHRCHQNLFTKDHIKELIKLAPKTLIISSYDREELRRAFEMSEIDAIQIPSERQKHLALPFRLHEFEQRIKESIVPGALVLVASGFAGKYFLKMAKDQGAIGLDVGAMADYWMGRKTRQISDIV